MALELKSMVKSFKPQASGSTDQVASMDLETASPKLDKLQAVGYNRIMKVRSKHNDLMNYFIVDHKYLSKQYIRKGKKFLCSLKKQTK